MLRWRGTVQGLWSTGLDHWLCTLQKDPPRQEATYRTPLSPRFYSPRTALSYPPLCYHSTKPSAAICPQPWGLGVVRFQRSQANETPMPASASYFLPLAMKFNPARPWALCCWPGLALPQLSYRYREDSFSSRDHSGHRERFHSSQQRGNTSHRRSNLQSDFFILGA